MNSFKPALMGAAVIAILLTAPLSLAHAQSALSAGVDTTAAVGNQGNYTLKQREDWLSRHIDMARDDGSIGHDEYDRIRGDLNGIRDQEGRMRGSHDGELTDNETAALETNLDSVASRIHWLHENNFQRPW